MVRHATFLIVILACCTARADGLTPFADALLWRASEETSSVWASAVSLSDSPETGPTTTFSPTDIDFDWNAGLRTGLEFQTDDSAWSAKLYWTHYVTSDRAAFTSEDQLVIPEFFSGFASGDAFLFTNAAIDWELALNTFDFEVGHELQLGDSLRLYPTLGVKGAVIRQTIRSQWSDPFLFLAATEDVDHDFRGIGPSFGMEGRWDVPRCQNLRVIGTFSAAFMYGVWNVHDTYQRTDPQPALDSYRAFSTDLTDSQLGTLMLRYFLGCEWAWQGNVDITARAGYELQWWANQQRLTTFQQLPMHGDLTLQGLTCGIAVSF
ncbi:Lpg1974 family pore-forming outer membrane protein [Symmachiella dynata]|uniref:Lpg1974 family pore-forming outer membrane protein n=1 Tax=Symmachiella dynata TaxID=2527995 RepID=UPI0030ED603E